MSRYNEQHATTMLNSLIGTNTLKQYKRDVIEDFVNGYIFESENLDCGDLDFNSCNRDDDYCCFRCYAERYIQRNCKLE